MCGAGVAVAVHVEVDGMVEQQRPRDDGWADGAARRGRGALRRARAVWKRVVDAATAVEGVVGGWSLLRGPAAVPVPVPVRVRVPPRGPGSR